MKKIVKIISWLILTLIIVAISLGTYIYQTNDMVRAMVNNDESKLYYFPSIAINEMEDLKYSETLLTENLLFQQVQLINHGFPFFGIFWCINHAGDNWPFFTQVGIDFDEIFLSFW